MRCRVEGGTRTPVGVLEVLTALLGQAVTDVLDDHLPSLARLGGHPLIYLNVKISRQQTDDHVDRVLAQGELVEPGADRSPVGVIARLGRLVSYVDRELEANFARFGINRAGWDVLASLRRSGPPYRLTPTELYRGLMRTSGAVTNQLHRLEGADLIRRIPDPEDGRSTLVELTGKGRALVSRVGPAHLKTERRLLGALDPQEREALASLSKKLLLSFEAEASEGRQGAEAAEPLVVARGRRLPPPARGGNRAGPGRRRPQTGDAGG